MSQKLVLKQQQQQLTVSQILRVYGKQFKQIQSRYSDGENGRCAIGVIMSYFGWDGRVNFDTAYDLLVASDVLKHTGIDEDLLTDMNDSGFTFDAIADYLERNNEMGFELIESCSENSIHYYL
jgi:hypothetical protein